MIYNRKLKNTKKKEFSLNSCQLLTISKDPEALALIPRLESILIQGHTRLKDNMEFYYDNEKNTKQYQYILGWIHSDNKSDQHTISKLSKYQEAKELVFGGKFGNKKQGTLHIYNTGQLGKIQNPKTREHLNKAFRFLGSDDLQYPKLLWVITHKEDAFFEFM